MSFAMWVRPEKIQSSVMLTELEKPEGRYARNLPAYEQFSQQLRAFLCELREGKGITDEKLFRYISERHISKKLCGCNTGLCSRGGGNEFDCWAVQGQKGFLYAHHSWGFVCGPFGKCEGEILELMLNSTWAEHDCLRRIVLSQLDSLFAKYPLIRDRRAGELVGWTEEDDRD